MVRKQTVGLTLLAARFPNKTVPPSRRNSFEYETEIGEQHNSKPPQRNFEYELVALGKLALAGSNRES